MKRLKILAAKIAAHKSKLAFVAFIALVIWKVFENTESVENFLFWFCLITLISSLVFYFVKKEMGEWLNKNKDKAETIILGHSFNATFDAFFNYPLYFSVIGYFGLIAGGQIMIVLSFLTCLAFLRFYDWLKIDWLGLEVAKEVAGEFGPGFIRNISAKSKLGKILWWPFSKIILFVLWSLGKGGFIAFFALSIFTDPFMTTVYMRKGIGCYDGLKTRDWAILVASTIVGNVYWSGRAFIIIMGFKFLWNLITG